MQERHQTDEGGAGGQKQQVSSGLEAPRSCGAQAWGRPAPAGLPAPFWAGRGRCGGGQAPAGKCWSVRSLLPAEESLADGGEDDDFMQRKNNPPADQSLRLTYPLGRSSRSWQGPRERKRR